MAKKLGFIVNSEKCIGCHSCEMACKNQNQLDPEIRWRKVYAIKEDSYGMPSRLYMSLSCNHCDSPQCLKACPVKAYTKREDGVVIHQHNRCIGCGMCIMACPYKVPQLNKHYKKVEKCHLCYSRLDNNEEPACVEECPAEAIDIIDLNNFEQFGTAGELPGFPDPNISKPSIRFIKPKIVVQVRRDS
jgi:DMSO reductase iron-sulfur subunit